MYNNGYSAEWLSKLKFKCDIVSVISRYMILKRKGKSHWGCCPFHHEKTPSFSVNETGQYFHCFGCGVGGDVIKFVQKMEAIDYFDAIKKLAKEAGMELPKLDNLDEEIVKKKQRRDLLIQICTDSARFYYKKLNEKVGYVAQKYLQDRGVDRTTIVKMGLGYSPDYSSLIKYLRGLGYKDEDILATGVANKSEKDGSLYDSFAKRLIFPVFNASGKVCGFSARALEKTTFAKYKNTASTEIFNKSYILYGVHLLKKARLEENRNYALLVEGQMDVIACHQAGFTNAIASLGTAFNAKHIQTLKRFVDKVIVCFDGDNAGKKAATEALEPLMEENFEVKVVSLPNGNDPDEYIKKHGAEAFEQLLNNAQNVWEFEINALASKFNLKDKLSLAKFVKEALNIIVRINNFTERDIYLKQISNISGVNEETLKRQFNDIVNKKTKQEAGDSAVKEQETSKQTEVLSEQGKLYYAEQFILASILHKKDYAKDINLNIFVNNNFKQFYDYLVKNNFPIVSQIFDDYDVENIAWLKDLIYYDFDKVVKLKEHFAGCYKLLQIEYLMEKQRLLSKELSIASGEDRIRILKQIQAITKEIQQKKVEE